MADQDIDKKIKITRNVLDCDQSNHSSNIFSCRLPSWIWSSRK